MWLECLQVKSQSQELRRRRGNGGDSKEVVDAAEGSLGKEHGG